MWQRRVSRLVLGMVLVCATILVQWKVNQDIMQVSGTLLKLPYRQDSIDSHGQNNNHHHNVSIAIHPFFKDPALSSILSVDSICGFGPGQGIEEDAGYKILVEKVQWSPSQDRLPPIKLFCGIYSYSLRRQQTLVQRLTWGRHCDGWTVFSNETWSLGGSIDLSHPGHESYSNMWQKVRSIWKYINDHFYQDYDYFYLGGDDVYVLVANLRALLGSLPRNDTIPRHIGQWLPIKTMIAGGPGYLLNRVSLQRLVVDGLPHCFVNTTASYEDRLISQCLARLGISGSQTDTRDEEGEQRFHDASPSMLYSFRAGVGNSYLAKMAKFWERLPHPQQDGSNRTVGRQVGLQAVAKWSVSFHHLYTPHYLARIHAILHGNLCPADSPLGKGLRQHTKYPWGQ